MCEGLGGRLLTKHVMNAVVSESSFYSASDAISLSHSVDPVMKTNACRNETSYRWELHHNTFIPSPTMHAHDKTLSLRKIVRTP